MVFSIGHHFLFQSMKVIFEMGKSPLFFHDLPPSSCYQSCQYLGFDHPDEPGLATLLQYDSGRGIVISETLKKEINPLDPQQEDKQRGLERTPPFPPDGCRKFQFLCSVISVVWQPNMERDVLGQLLSQFELQYNHLWIPYVSLLYLSERTCKVTRLNLQEDDYFETDCRFMVVESSINVIWGNLVHTTYWTIQGLIIQISIQISIQSRESNYLSIVTF